MIGDINPCYLVYKCECGKELKVDKVPIFGYIKHCPEKALRFIKAVYDVYGENDGNS